MNATGVETDRDEEYQDVPYEDEAGPWVDVGPKPETPPAKRLRAAYRVAVVSLHFELSRRFTDNVSKKKDPLEDLAGIRDILLLELCRHEGLRGLATESSGFPLCGDCGKLSGSLRCTECAIDAMYCPGCMCAKHCEQPLHRIQVCECWMRQPKTDLEVFCSDGRAPFLLRTRWLMLVLLFSLGTMGVVVQIPKFIGVY